MSPPTSPSTSRTDTTFPAHASNFFPGPFQIPRSKSNTIFPLVAEGQSRPSPAATARFGAPRRHTRGASLSSVPTTGNSKTEAFQSPFQRARTGNFSLSFASESNLQSVGKSVRSHELEQDMLLECMFGAVSLKGSETCTKVHVLPGDTKDTSVRPLSSGYHTSDGQTSFWHSPPPTTIPLDSPSVSSAGLKRSSKESRNIEAPSVLVTRVFSLKPSPNVDLWRNDPSAPRTESGKEAVESDLTRSQKSASFAVSIVVAIPRERFRERILRFPLIERESSLPSSIRSDALPSLGSSSNSDVHSSWARISAQSSPSVSLPNRSDVFHVGTRYIMQHWDTVMRTLDCLQFNLEAWIATCRTSSDSNIADLGSPDMEQKFGSECKLSRSQSETPKKHHSRFSLQRGGLQESIFIQTATKRAMTRLTKAFLVRKVVVGQSRWSAWREEARWVSRWASGAEQSHFLSRTLSAFLATHLSWMHLIKPTLKGIRRSLGLRRQPQSPSQYTRRTIIISPDRMAARRFIFLLAAFFPRHDGFDTCSGSTPSFSERPSPQSSSLRLSKMNSLGSDGTDGSRDSMTVSSHSVDSRRPVMVPRKSNLSTAIQSSRKLSIHSILTTRSTPPRVGATSPKPLGHAESTVDFTDSIPAVHLTAGHQGLTPYSSHNDSHNPAAIRRDASALLSSNLKLPMSHSLESRKFPRWSVFPGSPQDPVVHDQEALPSYVEQEASVTPVQNPVGSASSVIDENEFLEKARGEEFPGSGKWMRDELESPQKAKASKPLPIQHAPPNRNFETAGHLQPTPGLAESAELPFTLSVNDLDGTIDVAISHESETVPINSGEFSGNSLPGSLESFCSTPRPPDLSFAKPHDAVGGFLSSFHEDLAVQAVRCYKGLEKDIRDTMLSEACSGVSSLSPNHVAKSNEAWVNGSTTLIADLESLRVKRLRTRYLIDPLSQQQGDLLARDSIRGQSDSDMSDLHLNSNRTAQSPQPARQEIIEDDDLQPDQALSEALEQLHIHNWPSSNTGSCMVSRSNSERASSMRAGATTPPTLGRAGRGCKNVLIHALEQVVTDAASEFEHYPIKPDTSEHKHAPTSGSHRQEDHQVGSPVIQTAVKDWLRDWGRGQ